MRGGNYNLDYRTSWIGVVYRCLCSDSAKQQKMIVSRLMSCRLEAGRNRRAAMVPRSREPGISVNLSLLQFVG